ncbi:lysophospholipid acyltransferase family protein [Psychroflexus aestuariivivens]|uniref:lysophospholipid acyltransferase family protein n=1 Tax=Psychroflexus aestuariivivens TaxID=1795040 RepID=UPI000FDC3E17|nr:lysophospholipid acyltransferase family protein [Psychroflexus aestuariivivens]
MKKILTYPLSIVFYLCFGLTLVVFQVLQWFSLQLFGYQAHKKSVDIFNFFLMRCLNIVGTTFQIEKSYDLRRNRPHIIVANHQSMFDIPPIIWYLRQLHPKFISKIELAKGIPGISFNLRHGGSVLIDRKNPDQAVGQIKKLGQYICKFNRSAVIFPEGTRSRTGEPKAFAYKGLMTLFEACPDAVIVPVSIHNSWKLQKYGMFPINHGVKFRMKVHETLEIKDFQTDVLIQKLEQIISEDIRQNPK